MGELTVDKKDVDETALNIFEILGFNHLYRIHPSEMDAILSFAQDGGAGP